MKRTAFAMGCVIAATVGSSVSVWGNKSIVISSRAGDCLIALKRHVKGSKEVLTENMQAAFQQHPEKLQDFSQAIAGTLFLAQLRPTPAEIDESVQRLEKEHATLDDVIIATRAVITYGEAELGGGQLAHSPHEPTRSGAFYFDPFQFKSSLNQAYDIISELGQKMKWDKEKIQQEQDSLTRNLAQMLQQYQNRDKAVSEGSVEHKGDAQQ